MGTNGLLLDWFWWLTGLQLEFKVLVLTDKALRGLGHPYTILSWLWSTEVLMLELLYGRREVAAGRMFSTRVSWLWVLALSLVQT